VDFAPGANKRRRADVVFTRLRIAVFIDGCFWHGCRIHTTVPRTNVTYWGPKLARNGARDMNTTAELTDQGWTVLRYWEHENVEAIADDIYKRVAVASGVPPTPSTPLA
jgi:DNA mismatch endonuclease (patch repair protein)